MIPAIIVAMLAVVEAPVVVPHIAVEPVVPHVSVEPAAPHVSTPPAIEEAPTVRPVAPIVIPHPAPTASQPNTNDMTPEEQNNSTLVVIGILCAIAILVSVFLFTI